VQRTHWTSAKSTSTFTENSHLISSFPSRRHDFRAVLAVKGSLAPRRESSAPLTAAGRSEPRSTMEGM
jgi:hypothetical protein